jgi:hypothetical protein
MLVPYASPWRNLPESPLRTEYASSALPFLETQPTGGLPTSYPSKDMLMEDAAEAACTRLISMLDANRDGSISKDELSTFQSNLEAQLTGTASGQQSQAGGIRSLVTQAISMYAKLSPLSGLGSFAAIA